MSYFISGQPTIFVTRIVEYKGEKWRCTSFSGTHATLDIVNDPDKPYRDDILTLSRKTFFECLLPRTVTHSNDGYGK